MGNDPLNLTDPSGKCPNCLSGGIGAAIGGAFGLATSTFSEFTDGKPGVSLGNIAKNTGKGIVVGGVTGFTGNPYLGAATAGGLGGADGAITAAVNGGSLGDIAASAVSQATIEGLGTLAGGKFGEKVIGSAVKQEISGNLAAVASTSLANGVVSNAPDAVDALAGGIKDTVQSMQSGFDEGLDRLENPAPMFDPMGEDE